MYFFLNLITG